MVLVCLVYIYIYISWFVCAFVKCLLFFYAKVFLTYANAIMLYISFCLLFFCSALCVKDACMLLSARLIYCFQVLCNNPWCIATTSYPRTPPRWHPDAPTTNAIQWCTSLPHPSWACVSGAAGVNSLNSAVPACCSDPMKGKNFFKRHN